MGLIFGIIRHRRVIKFSILGALIIVLGVVVYVQYFSRTPPPEGALRIVKCAACGDRSVKLIKDINDRHDPKCVCGKCGKPVGYAFKCDNCDFEFPVIPEDKPFPEATSKMKTMGKFKHVLQLRKCLNCGSTQTHPMSVEK